jgi:DNA polymerase I
MTSRAPIIWDFETHLIKPGLTAPKMVCLSTAEMGQDAKLYTREEGLDVAERIVEENLSGGHHIFFDLGVLAADRPRSIPKIFRAFDEGRLHCTKIRQMMIDNCNGQLKFEWNEETMEYKKQNYQLFRLVQRHLGYDISAQKKGGNVWRMRYSELDDVPLSEWPEDAKQYPKDDAIETRDVWVSQQEKDIDPESIPGFEAEMRSAWALNLMGTHGVRTDPKAVAEYKAELKIDFARYVKVCQEHGFRRDGGKQGISRDMKKIQGAIERWYKDHERKMRLTPKGKVATDREQLTTTDHKGLNAVAESVRAEKLLTTYVAALERGTVVPLNPNYNPIIETFRTSCSGGMKIDGVPVGMNVQNLPRKGKVRECIIPREGNIFAFCDYDTLEMRTLAQICLDLFGYSEIAEAIKAGRDLHLDLAASMLNMSYEMALARFNAGDAEMINARQFCKIGNYGFAGGMGPRAFVDYAKSMGGIIVTPDQAMSLWKGFRARWREMNDYFAHCAFLAGDGNAEHVVFERTGQVRGDVPYTAICNGFFQHLAARGAKDSCYDVAKECYVETSSPLFGCRPWLFAHDEIGMEIPYEAFGPKRTHEAAMRLQQVMIGTMKRWVPGVPIGATVAMTRRWYKGADPLVEKGLLVPVRPEKYMKDGKEKTRWVSDARSR